MVARLDFVSPEEYLALEREAEYKSEYVNGVIYAMSGGSPEHSLISGNVLAEIHLQLKKSPCQVYNTDMKVRVPSSLKYHYPDVTVVCDKPRYADEVGDVLLNPLLIVEVLSETTAAFDRGKKFQYYQEIVSFQEYLLVAQDEPVVERFVKQAGGSWIYTKFEGLDEKVALSSIDCQLSLRDIYAKVL
jgi:Uma2 family endonuclease